MKLCMTNKGVSEQLVALEVEITSDDMIGHVSEEVYKSMQENYSPLHCSMYAMISVKARIQWRDPNTSKDFVNAYNKSRFENGKKIDPSRIQDVLKYAEKINQGEIFPKPVFKNQSGLLIQIDGARRIMAHLLSNHNEIDVDIIMLREHIKTLLKPELIQRVKDIYATNRWFKRYQDIIELGISGTRRFGCRFPNVLDFSRVRGHTVVDFGCNNGMALFQAYYCGASKAIGFDFVQENVDIINLMAGALNIPVVGYRLDFNDKDFGPKALANTGGWDYSLFLSVYRTKELKDRDGLVEFIWKNTRCGMFFEGHGHPQLDSPVIYDKILHGLQDAKVTRLPKGIIEAPYDPSYRPKYLVTR